jgi:predicted transcriptional regulator
MPRPRGARTADSRPTDGELEILQVMWQLNAPATTRDVHDEIVKSRDVTYKSVSTMIQLMEKRGLVGVTDSRRPKKYKPTYDNKKTFDVIVKDLATRLFGGSTKSLALHLLAGVKASPAEKANVKKALEQLE